jgi:HicB family
MAVSVRMDPLLEKELELAAQRQGLSKSQFIISAVERALGRKNPYELMMALKAEEPAGHYRVEEPRAGYKAEASKAAISKKLKAKHHVSGAR